MFISHPTESSRVQQEVTKYLLCAASQGGTEQTKQSSHGSSDAISSRTSCYVTGVG